MKWWLCESISPSFFLLLFSLCIPIFHISFWVHAFDMHTYVQRLVQNVSIKNLDNEMGENGHFSTGLNDFLHRKYENTYMCSAETFFFVGVRDSYVWLSHHYQLISLELDRYLILTGEMNQIKRVKCTAGPQIWLGVSS
jgi:hypothetical protein